MATVVYVPKGYLVNGHRLIDEVRIYERGVIARRRDSARKIVFDSVDLVCDALGVSITLFVSWPSAEIEALERPCLECRSSVIETNDHAPTCSAFIPRTKRKKKEN